MYSNENAFLVIGKDLLLAMIIAKGAVRVCFYDCLQIRGSTFVTPSPFPSPFPVRGWAHPASGQVSFFAAFIAAWRFR